MTEQARSYWKTVVVAGTVSMLAAATVAIAVWAAFGPLRGQSGLVWLGWSTALVALLMLGKFAGLVTAGGLIALKRDALEEAGLPYASGERRESLVGPLRGRLFRTLRRNDRADGTPRPRLGLRPGEWVQVRTFEEILSTLDERGRLDGVPFMPEMAAYCGRHVRVFRRVDKMNNWVGGGGLTRTQDLVLLDGLRCDGSAHGGCQASCHLRWREAWLRRAAPPADSERRPVVPVDAASLVPHGVRAGDDGSLLYVCQATELTGGAPPLRLGDPRHFLRELWYGNVRLRPFLTGVAVMSFNWAQRKRGGSGFPSYTPAGAGTLPADDLQLRAGDLVRVKPKHAIEATLNAKSRNKGLYFDRDLLRFCGGEFTVHERLQRVVVERTGKLIDLPTPCITLDGVTATGEYFGFNPENEYIFWREAWLERV